MQNNRDVTYAEPAGSSGPFRCSSVLPNSPLFGQLLRHAYRKRLAIRDVNLDLDKTYADVLVDAVKLRARMMDGLSYEVKHALEKDDEVFVGVLAQGGYEYVVAVLAVLALGAAVVPMSMFWTVPHVMDNSDSLQLPLCQSTRRVILSRNPDRLLFS